jgi:hypothetical protein
MTTRDVLRLREFRLLFAGHGVSVFGNRMVAVAIVFAVLELGGYPIGLAIWGPLAGAIGIHTALWLASGLFLAALVALLAVPDIRRLSAFARAQTPVA